MGGQWPKFIKIGSRILNLDMVTDIDLDTSYAMPVPENRFHKEPAVVVYLAANAMHEWHDGGGVSIARTLVFYGREAAMLRGFFTGMLAQGIGYRTGTFTGGVTGPEEQVEGL